MSGPTPIASIRINGERLWDSLMEMAEVGKAEEGGCNRVALTDEDKAGQELFIEWASDTGCRIVRDRIGNLFAERAGTDEERPQILIGSHLDTVPKGGKFDGPYGVLAGLEIVRTLNEHNVKTDAPVVIVSWANEEGARFPQPAIGSGVFAGVLTLEQALAQPAHDGPSFGEELARLDLIGEEEVGSRRIGAYFEGHIEQGRVLESTGTAIGVVTRGQGLRAIQVILTGAESHAGTTPMDARRDALLGAARIVERARSLAGEVEESLLTVGLLSVEPNSRAVIPGRAALVVDMRHKDKETLEDLELRVRKEVEKIAAAADLALEQWMFLGIGPTVFDEACNGSIRHAAAELGYPSMDIMSMAAHDAMYIARVAPTALMFVPCRDGVSHSPAEYASPEDLQAGCDVLLQAALPWAGVAA